MAGSAHLTNNTTASSLISPELDALGRGTGHGPSKNERRRGDPRNSEPHIYRRRLPLFLSRGCRLACRRCRIFHQHFGQRMSSKLQLPFCRRSRATGSGPTRRHDPVIFVMSHTKPYTCGCKICIGYAWLTDPVSHVKPA